MYRLSAGADVRRSSMVDSKTKEKHQHGIARKKGRWNDLYDLTALMTQDP